MKKIIWLLISWIFITNCWALQPKISIIVDDLGNSLPRGLQTIYLPGAVTCAFLPYRPHTKLLAIKAHMTGKEVMLHAPMQALEPLSLGRGALRLNMSKKQIDQTILDDMRVVPYAQGFNNHMGSLMTQHPGDMNWIMQAIKPLGVYFVDSRTIANSVAEKIAHENNIPATRRNIFLDDQRSSKYIAKQFAKLLHRARVLGSGVAIAHPYPVTLAFLQKELPLLKSQNISLVPISQIIKEQAT